ncbi:GntR family transcriptional regulator [Marivita sp. S6314]|uniref:GntR family transcriptional regulator n=1 Tax=Marivita sp. S6314 TaxID=2926406 RepID=UPI001FF4CF26|nr:GntR family transcriptional regulator [Marivita sp. S6314]MCK0151727.1 GntR family transcriptional regulator [Marivita sp. S6314]
MSTTYREVKADILRQITQGELAPGSILPNEVDLAASYGCARATVNRAMRELADDGLIERRRKAGSRVRRNPLRQAKFNIPLVQQEVEEQGSVYRYALVSRDIAPASDRLRARLGLQSSDRLLHLICMHYADDAPYQYENRWINLAATPDAETFDFSQTGPNEWLVKQVPFTDVQISFRAIQADAVYAEHLDCARGDALFQVERTTRQDDEPVTFVQLTYRQGHRLTTRY